jgi:arginase
MTSVGVAAGLGIEGLGVIYFDAHDDMHTPSTIMNGYFDAMGLSMLTGGSFHGLMATVPGFVPQSYDKVIHCGLRDVTEEERKIVEQSAAEVVWGGAGKPDSFPDELLKRLERRSFSPALVHLDLDVLDESVGKVNGYESPGGISEVELVQCIGMVPYRARVMSLTVCSFDPSLGDGDKIGKIAVEAIVAFATSLFQVGIL